MTTRMRFGTFMAPFHPAGENPTLLLDGDLALLEHMDRLGFDEAWIGEHHSAGTEVIASPEIFIATAAERTPSGWPSGRCCSITSPRAASCWASARAPCPATRP